MVVPALLMLPTVWSHTSELEEAIPRPQLLYPVNISPSTPANWLTGGFGAGANLANTTPTAQYLANNLNANHAVEITLQWGSLSGNTFNVGNGAHEVTLESINLGAGTISFYDPWGNGINNASGTGVLVNGTVQLLNGFSVVSYPIDWVGPDDITASTTAVGINSGQTGIILDDMVQSVVPEASSILLVAMGLAAFAVPCVRRARSAK